MAFPVAVVLFLVGRLGTGIDGFTGADGWFHARYVDLLVRGEAPWHGLSFPWVAESAFADLPMDWALGWHWALAPFVRIAGAETGALMGLAVFVGIFSAALTCTLRTSGVRFPLAWTCVAVLASPFWVFRLFFGRPTTLVVAALLLLAWAILHKRTWATAVAAFVVMALYHVPATPLAVTAACLAGLWIADRKVPWRLGAAALAGIALAVVAHPGFWSFAEGGDPPGRATFHVWGLLSESLEHGAGGDPILEIAEGVAVSVPMPAELRAADLAGLAREFWGALAATVLAVVFGFRRRKDPFAVAGGLLAAGFLYATFVSGRLVDYWVPFAFFGAACAVGRTEWTSRWRRVAGATFVVASLAGVAHYPALFSGPPRPDGVQVRPAAEAIARAAETGDVVFQGAWDDFAPAFHWNWKVKWLTGMDPWYMVAHDPEDFVVHALAVGGKLDSDSLHNAVVDRFKARFVLLWRSRPNDHRYDIVEEQLRAASWATVIHSDAATVAFRVE